MASVQYGSLHLSEDVAEERILYRKAARKSAVIAATALALTCVVGALVVVAPTHAELVATFTNAASASNAAAYAKKVNHDILSENGTLCLNETRWNKNKDKMVVFDHNCMTSGWGSVSKVECQYEHRVNPNMANPACETEYIMLYQEFSKLDTSGGEDVEGDVDIVHKMQEFEENGRNCLCLKYFDQCMQMIFPSKDPGGYFYGTVRLNGNVNKCTPFNIKPNHMICSAYPPEPPEYWRWCIGAVHGQGSADEGHVRLYDRDDEKHASLMRWNFALDPEFERLLKKEGGDWNAGIKTRKGTWNRTYDCSEFDGDQEGCNNAEFIGKPCAWGTEDQLDINGEIECVNTNDVRSERTAAPEVLDA